MSKIKHKTLIKIIAMVVVCLFTLNNLVWANPDLFQRSAPATLAVTPYSHDLSDEKLIETAIKFELEAQPGILEDGKRHHRVPKVFGIPVDIYFHPDNKRGDSFVVACSVRGKEYNAALDMKDLAAPPKIARSDTPLADILKKEEKTPPPTDHMEETPKTADKRTDTSKAKPSRGGDGTNNPRSGLARTWGLVILAGLTAVGVGFLRLLQSGFLSNWADHAPPVQGASMLPFSIALVLFIFFLAVLTILDFSDKLALGEYQPDFEGDRPPVFLVLGRDSTKRNRLTKIMQSYIRLNYIYAHETKLDIEAERFRAKLRETKKGLFPGCLIEVSNRGVRLSDLKRMIENEGFAISAVIYLDISPGAQKAVDSWERKGIYTLSARGKKRRKIVQRLEENGKIAFIPYGGKVVADSDEIATKSKEGKGPERARPETEIDEKSAHKKRSEQIEILSVDGYETIIINSREKDDQGFYIQDVEARRKAEEIAKEHELDLKEQLRIIELTRGLVTNILEHAGEGVLAIKATTEDEEKTEIELVAWDSGPGIANPEKTRRESIKRQAAAPTAGDISERTVGLGFCTFGVKSDKATIESMGRRWEKAPDGSFHYAGASTVKKGTRVRLAAYFQKPVDEYADTPNIYASDFLKDKIIVARKDASDTLPGEVTLRACEICDLGKKELPDVIDSLERWLASGGVLKSHVPRIKELIADFEKAAKDDSFLKSRTNNRVYLALSAPDAKSAGSRPEVEGLIDINDAGGATWFGTWEVRLANRSKSTEGVRFIGVARQILRYAVNREILRHDEDHSFSFRIAAEGALDAEGLYWFKEYKRGFLLKYLRKQSADTLDDLRGFAEAGDENAKAILEQLEGVAGKPGVLSLKRTYKPSRGPEKITPMTTSRGRLFIGISLIRKVLSKFGEKPVVYDIGTGWPPATSVELAESIPEARIIGIDKQIPSFVIIDEELPNAPSAFLFNEEGELFLADHCGNHYNAEEVPADKQKWEDIAKELRREAGDRQEYTSGTNTIIFDPFKRFELENLQFVKGDMFRIKGAAEKNNLPKAHVVRIANVMLYYHTEKERLDALRALLNVVEDGGYVLIGGGGLFKSPDTYLVYRKRGDKFKLENFVFGISESDALGVIISGIGSVNDTPSLAAFLKAAEDAVKETPEYKNKDLHGIAGILVRELTSQGLKAASAGNVVNIKIDLSKPEKEGIAGIFIQAIESVLKGSEERPAMPLEVTSPSAGADETGGGGLNLNQMMDWIRGADARDHNALDQIARLLITEIMAGEINPTFMVFSREDVEKALYQLTQDGHGLKCKRIALKISKIKSFTIKRKVSSIGFFTHKRKAYRVGRSLAGKKVTLIPLRGDDWGSGFKVFYENKQIAHYNASKDKYVRSRAPGKGRTRLPKSKISLPKEEKTALTRRVSSKGQISWNNIQIYVGIHLAGKLLTLKPLEGGSFEYGFRAFDRDVCVGHYDVSGNVTCGTVCESGHEGFRKALDEQLRRFYEALAKDAGRKRDLGKNPLTGDEVIDDLEKTGRITDREGDINAALLKEIKAHVEEKIPGIRERNIQLLFAIPEDGKKLWWVRDPKTGEMTYAGGHFSKSGTRIHISLPLIRSIFLEKGADKTKEAAEAIARHDFNHIENHAHNNDDAGMKIVKKALSDRLKKVIRFSNCLGSLVKAITDPDHHEFNSSRESTEALDLFIDKGLIEKEMVKDIAHLLLRGLSSNRPYIRASSVTVLEALEETGLIDLDKAIRECPVSTDVFLHDLQNEDSGTRHIRINTLKFLVKKGLIGAEEIRGKIPLMRVILEDLASRDEAVRKKGAEALKFLKEAGAISKEEVRGEISVDILLQGLAGDQATCQANADALRSLIGMGLIDKDEIKGKIPVDTITQGISGSSYELRKARAIAIKTLIEAGLVDKKTVTGKIPQDMLLQSLSSQYRLEIDASAEALGALAKAGLIDKKEVRKRISIEVLLKNLSSSAAWILHLSSAWSLKTLKEAGLISAKDVKGKIPLNHLQKELSSADENARQGNAHAIVTLFGAGLISKKEVLENGLVYDFLLGLEDDSLRVTDASADALKLFIKKGLITKETAKEPHFIHVLLNGLSNYRDHVRRNSAETLKALGKAGLIDKEKIKGKISLERLLKDLFDSASYTTRKESANVLAILIEAGLVDKDEIRGFAWDELNGLFLSVYGKDLDPRFKHFWLKLYWRLINDSETAGRIDKYFDEGLLAILEDQNSEGGMNWYLYTELIELIKTNTPAEEAKKTIRQKAVTTLTGKLRQFAEHHSSSSPDQSFVLGKLLAALIKDGADISELSDALKKAFMLARIEFRDGGNSSTTTSAMAEGCLTALPPLETSALPVDPPSSESKYVRDVPKVDASSLESILNGATLYKTLGRTLVYKTKEGKFTAIKFLKKEEDAGALEYESRMFDYLNELKEKGVGLRGEYPEAALINGSRVVRISEENLPLGLKDKLAGIMSQSDKRGQAIEIDTRYKSYTFMAYSTESPDYFTYLHEIKDEAAANEAAQKNIHDLFTLARYGLIHPDIIELFHNLEQHGRTDRGKYLWMIDIIRPMGGRQGAGRIHAWERTVNYPNMRLSGPADFAEISQLGDLIYLGHMHSIHMSNNLVRFSLEDRKRIILASFMGNYMLSLVFSEGKRLKAAGKLKWDDPGSVSALADIIKKAYSTAYKAFTGRVDTEVSALVDWHMLARQMAFFMSGEYAEYLKAGELPGGMYDPITNVSITDELEFSRGWTENGWMHDGENADLGPVNGPLPLQEFIKANYIYTMFMIGVVASKEKPEPAPVAGIKKESGVEYMSYPPYAKETIDAYKKAGRIQVKAAKLAGISDRAFSKRRKKIIDAAVKSGDLEIARILALPFYAEDTLKALQEAKGDRKEAARMLGITITPLFKRIKRIKNIAKEIGDKDMLDKMKDARKKTPKYPAYTEGTLKALKASNGNRTEAAGRLGVNRRTIHKRIERIKGIASQVGDEAVLEKLRLKKLVPAAKPAAKPVKRPRTRQASSEKPKRVKLTEIIRQSSLVKLISQATGIPEEKITEKFTKGKGKLTSEDLKFERGKALIPLKKILKNVYGKFRDVIYDFGFEEDAVKIAFISGARMYTVLIVLGAKSWRAEDSSPYLAVSRRDPGKVALLLEVAEKLSDKHYLDLAPVAGTENAEEKGLAEAFTEFNALCRENLKLIRRYIEEGNNEAAANCAAQITQGRKSAFAHISNNDFKDLMTDLLQSIGAISLFIHGALEKEALYECLDETEKSLTELEKLMIAGRLREAGKARVRSGLFDASLVLGPGEGAAPKCFNSGRSGERKKVSYQDLEFLPEYDGVCIGFDKRYYGKTMEETFNPGRFLEFKKKKGEHALLVHDTLARALGLFRDMLISSLSDEKRADEAMELYDAFWNDVRRHRGLLIRIASNLPWDSALLETGGIPVLVFNEEFFKDAILGYYFPHEYDPEDPDARNEHRYTSLWPLCERLNHELSHSGLFKDDKLEEMKEEAGCIYRDLLFLKIILLAESNLDMKGRVDKYMENLHDRYGSNNYYEFLYSLVKAKKSKAKSKIWAYVTKHREGHQAFGIKPFPSDLSKEKIIAGKALENIGNATNDLEKARNIFMWVRENMAYAFDLGWDAPVSEVLEKGYGHCGNLSRLTLALLKASGIRSRLVIRHMSSKFYRNFIMPRIYRAMDNSKKGRSRHAYVEAFIDGKWHVLDYILNSNISEKSHPEDRDPEEAVFESFDECLSEYPPLANKERVRKYLTRQFYRNHFSEWDGRYRLVREIQELFSATKPTRLDEVPAAGVEKPGSPAGEGGGTNNPNAGFTFAEFLTGFGTLVGGALVLINKPLKGFLSSWAAHAPPAWALLPVFAGFALAFLAVFSILHITGDSPRIPQVPDYSRLTEKWKVIEDKETGFLNCYLTLLKEKEEIGFISLEIEPRGIVLLACGGLAVRKTRKGYGTTLLLRGLMLAQEEAWKRGIYPPWAYIYSIPGPDNLVEVLDRFFRKFGFRSEISEKVEQDPEYDALAGLIKDYPDVKDREKYKHWFKRLAQPGKPSVPAAGANKEKKLSEKELPMVREVAPEDVIGPGQIGPLPVTFVRSPTYFHDFGLEPFAYLFANRPDQVVRFRFDENHGIKAPDLETILQTTSSPYQLRWAYSGVIIDWVRGVSPEASQAEIGFSEDSENYYITGKLPGTYAQERLDAALAGTYSRGEQLMIRVKSQNDLSSPYASITIAIPKKELKQLADLHRNILRRTSSLADYLLKIAQRLDEKDPSQAAFRGLLPEMVRHLFSIHTKDRAAAIAALKEAPRGVVKFAIETFIDLGDEIRVGPDNRIGSDEYGESNKTGLPLGYYSSTYHDVIEPLRLEAIKLAGARRMHEFSDRLIELLDQSKYGDLPPESKDGHFTGIDGDLSSCISQRQEAAKALANIAKVHPPTLEKLIVVAGAKHKAPWWVKVSAIRALSMIEGRDERADSVLKEALEFNDEYAGNVIYVRDQSAHDPGILRKILVPEAMLALAKRGAKDIKPGVLEMLAMEGKDLAGTFPGRDILNKIIDALGYIGDEEAVGILYKYAEDTRYDHVIRIKALHALFRIDPKSKKFLKLLLGIWFYVWDLSGIYGAPDFKSDVTDENRFVEYYQKIKELWKDKKKGHNWQTDCVRNEVVPIMMEMNVRYFMDQGMKLTHDGGTPEWEVNGSALKSLLGSNSNNQEALGELLALYWRIDHYDYVSTSYILAEDLEIFGEIIAGLDLSANLKYPEGEHSIAAADLIQAAMKPKEQMDNAFRDAVKRSTIKHLSWRMFREHEALVGEVAFSPDFAGQFQEGYLHPVKAPPPGSTEEKDIPKGGLVPPGLFTEMIKAAEDENALRDIARQISSETAEREIAGQKELFLQDMAQALEDIARESAHLRAKCDKVARLLEENGIKLKYRGPPSAASGAYRSSGKRKPTKTIVEIDARALCKTYGTISKVPGEFWEWMASLGVGAIWLKSPWQESPLSGKLMRDWSRTHSESMVKRQASGYDVYRYKFNPEVARSKQEFRKVAEYLREKHDIRVILDFVTNHIAADSPLIKRVPQLVISRKDPGFPGDQYSSPYVKNPDIIIQHARFGPFGVPSGPNLAQLNHLTPNARRFMQKVIKKIADLTRGGGFRADLAHLFLKEVIREIWKWPLNIGDDEFDRLMRGEPWEEVLDAVRAEYPDLLVVAETYGHHGKFRSMGMVPYDKQIYDLLVAGNVNTLRWFLFMNCSAGELKQSVHFIENHDEYPAAEAFGSSERAIAAAAVSYAIPGYPLVPLRQILGMGTPEGAVKEMKSPDGGIYEFSYSDTLSDSSVIMPPLAELLWFVSRPVFRQGEFYSACPENLNLENSGLIPFTRHLDGEDALCLVNYSGRPIQATISLDTVYKFYENRPGVPGKITGELKDIVRSKGVKISFDHRRITVDLPPWGYGLFHFAENELDVTAFPASRSIRSDDLPNYADRPAEWWVDHIFENNSGMGQEGLVRKILEEHDRKHNTNKKEKFERLLLNRAAAVFTAEELAEAFKNGLLLPGQIDDLKKLLAAGKGRTTLEEFQLRYGVPKIEKRGPPPGTAATLLEYMFGYDWRDGKYHPELVVSRDNPQSIAEMTEGREKRGAGKISKSTVYNERTTLEWGGLIEYDNHKKVHYLPDWVLALGFEEIIQQIPELNDLRSVWIERILRIQEKGKKLRKKAGAAKGKNEAGKKDDAGVKDEVHSKGIHERPAKALVGTCKKIYGILPGVKIVFTGEGTRVENPKTVLDFECLRKKGEKEGGRFIYRGEIKVAVSGDHPDGELRKAASVLTVLVEDERFGNGFEPDEPVEGPDGRKYTGDMLKAEIDKQLNGLEAERELKSVILAKKPGAAGIKKELLNDRHCICSYWKKASEGLVLPKEALLRQSLVELDAIEREFESLSAGKTGIAGNKELAGLIEDIGKNAMGYHFALSYLLEYGGESLISAGSVAANLLRRLENIVGFCRQMRGRSGEAEETLTGEESGQTQVSAEGFGEEEGEEKTNISKELTVAKLYLDHLADYIKFFMKQDAKAKPVIDYDIDEAEGEENDDDGLFSLKGPLDRHLKKIDARPEVDLEIDILSWRRATEAVTLLKYAAAKTGILKKNDLKLISEIRKTASKCLKAFRNRKKGTLLSGVDLDKYGSRVVTMIWRLEDIVRLCGKIASKRKNPPPGGTKDGGWDEKDRGNKGRGKTLRDFGMLVVATAVTRLIAPWLGVIVGILACYVLVSHIADMFGSREEGGEPEPAPAGTEETRSADQEKMTLEEAYRFLYGLYGDPGTRLGDDDINFSKELAEEILKRPIDRIMIVGTGLIMLPLLLALTGKNVTLVGLDPVWEKAMPELVRVVNDELVKAGKFGDIEIKALTSEIGALDLEEHGLEPHSFDLVTFIDLIGTAYPKGEPSAWIRKAEELLKPEAYLVADESQGLITEAFDETFPRREMLSGGVYFKGAYEAEGSKNRFYRISNASKTRPEVPGMAKKKPAAGAEEKLTEVPDNRKMAIKEFAALLELLKKDPKVAWGKKNEFSARVEYENVTQDFEVFPTKECLESYPELELLDMSTGDDKVPSLGLFGVLRINVVKRGDELALWFREVHPSRGYRQIKPEKRRIAEYGPWSSRTIEHIIGLARQAGFKRFYASTAKNRAEWYKRELKVKIMSKNLEENYFLPFVNGWEEIEVELDGQRTRFWRWTNTKSTTKAPGRSSGKPEYIAQAEALIGSIGITEGSTVVSVGPGMSGTPSYYEQYPVVPWEKLFISEGADVSVYEPDLHSNKQWQNLVNVWQRRYSGKLKVLPSEQGYFEKAEIEPASVDAVVMMSVLSSKGISVMAKAMILLNALKSLKPEGRLVIGWFNGTKNQSKEYERTREIIQMLKNMGYVFEQVAGGAEPRATRGEHKRRFLTHNWVCYKIKPPAASQQNDRTYDGISPSGRKFFAKGIIAFIAASLAIARSAFAQAASEASARTQTYFSEILELFYDHPVLAGTAAFFAICTAFITAYLSHKVVKNKLKLSVTRTEVHDYTQYWPVAYHGQASRVAKGTDEYERDIRVCEVEDFTGTWIFLKATLLPVFLNALVNIVACSLGILNNIQTIVIIPLIGIPAGLLLLVLVLFAELIFPYFRIIMKHLYWRTVISDLYPRKHRIQSRALREMWKKKEELPEWDEKPLIFNIYHASKNTVTILDKPAYAVKTPGKETKELRIGQKLDYLPASMHEDPSSASGFVRIDPLKEGRTPDAEELFYKAAKLLVSASVNGGKNLILTGASRNIIEKGFGIELPGVLSLGEFTGIIESAKRGKKVKTGERTAALATDIASFGFSVRSHVRDVKITAPHGIHARSAKSIVEACQNYPNVKAMLLNGGRKAEAGSLLELICLGAGQNAVVRIVAEGKGANLLIEEIAGCLDPGSGKTKDRSPPKEEDKFVSPVQFREWTEAGEWGFAMTEIRELLKLPAENAKKILRDYLLEVDVKHHMDIIEKMKSAPDAENFDTFINHAEEVLQRSNDAQLIEAKRPLEPEQENNLKITHYNGGEQIEEDLLSRADELAKSVFRGGFLKLKERMKNPVFKLVLAVVKERPVGFMLYSLGQESARVSYYGVSDDQRRKGIAKAMFRELIEKTRREGAKKLVLDRVNDTDPAMKKIYEMLEREFRLKLKEKIQRLDGTASMVDAVFEIPYIEKEAPEKAIVRTPESPLRDLRDPIEAAECLKDLLVTLWYNKKVVLAFDSELGNRQVGNPLDVTESLKRLKKDPMYKRVLKNLVIVKSKPEKLHNKVQKYLYDDSSAIFVFAKAGAKKTLRKLSSKPRVRSTFIDENGMPSDTHYPLAEIVTIALAEYIRSMISGKNPTTKLMMGDQMLDLEKINIESITKEEGVLIVKLYTKATKQDTQLILQKYAELKRCLKAA